MDDCKYMTWRCNCMDNVLHLNWLGFEESYSLLKAQLQADLYGSIAHKASNSFDLFGLGKASQPRKMLSFHYKSEERSHDLSETV